MNCYWIPAGETAHLEVHVSLKQIDQKPRTSMSELAEKLSDATKRLMEDGATSIKISYTDMLNIDQNPNPEMGTFHVTAERRSKP